ncbi:MAG: hypothetical protein V4557_14635 [Bacteroidota bacterium]
MKNLKTLICCILLLTTIGSFAQENDVDEQKGKFKHENIFIGGGLNLGFGNRSFNVGLTPELGYSITRWLDAGLAFNINYFSQNASDFGSSVQFRNFSYGGGPFVRVWPVNFLFLQAQPEYNWTTSSQKDVVTNQTGTFHNNVGSLLVGVGYGTRVLGSHYSYLTLMIDVLQNRNSPYRNLYTNDPLPVFRAGFCFYLKGKQR